MGNNFLPCPICGASAVYSPLWANSVFNRFVHPDNECERSKCLVSDIGNQIVAERIGNTHLNYIEYEENKKT